MAIRLFLLRFDSIIQDLQLFYFITNFSIVGLSIYLFVGRTKHGHQMIECFQNCAVENKKFIEIVHIKMIVCSWCTIQIDNAMKRQMK